MENSMIYYILISLLVIYLIWLYFKSKNDFFSQDRETLAEKRNEVVLLLKFKGLNSYEIDEFTDAYDFFCKFTTKFDGATFVKDLHDIRNLDLKALKHDYRCLIGANRSFRKWIKEAWNYYQDHFKLGNGNQLLRFIGLLIIGVFFVPYCYIFTPKYYHKK